MDNYEKSLREIMKQRGYCGLTVDTVISATEQNPRAKKDFPDLLKNIRSGRELIKIIQPYVRKRKCTIVMTDLRKFLVPVSDNPSIDGIVIDPDTHLLFLEKDFLLQHLHL